MNMANTKCYVCVPIVNDLCLPLLYCMLTVLLRALHAVGQHLQHLLWYPTVQHLLWYPTIQPWHKQVLPRHSVALPWHA